MPKLYNQIPIETWKKIAYKVQRLKISDCSDYEFEKNLKLLQKLLSEDTDISLELNKRKPKNLEEIGLASLLYSIYNDRGICGWETYIKSDFYEYICALNDLNISSMAYVPTGVDTLQETLSTRTWQVNNYMTRRKIYTDGTFKLKNHECINGDYSELIDLKDASFLISASLRSDLDFTNTKVNNSHAIVKCFKSKNYLLPSKEEVAGFEFPELKIKGKDIIQWGASPEYIQAYDRLDMNELSCSKRLTKTPKGMFYYKEYKNK